MLNEEKSASGGKERKKILMVIANSGFNDTEYAVPRKIFEDNGFEVEVASLV